MASYGKRNRKWQLMLETTVTGNLWSGTSDVHEPVRFVEGWARGVRAL
jgi:hypothetical protein